MEPPRHSATPENIAFIDAVADFFEELFRAVLAGKKPWAAAQRLESKFGIIWSNELHEDLQQAAKVLASAWRFRIPVPWSVEEYCAAQSKKPRGLNATVENDLLVRFPPLTSVDDVLQNNHLLLRRPGVFVDSCGKVIAWSLPGILSKDRQVAMIKATEHVRDQIKTTGEKKDASRLMNQWRTAPTFYRIGRDWPPGNWLATPAGYAVGHKTAQYQPVPSGTLNHARSIEWCRDTRETGALLSAILRVAHPELYWAGRESLIEASVLPRVQDVISLWPTVFNTVQLISNRESPFHRDTAGQAPWYDLLVTLGSYRRAELVFRNLVVQVSYKPGTIALISGLVIHHGVRAVEPDRLCYSWFMSDALHGNLGIHPVPWMSLDTYDP